MTGFRYYVAAIAAVFAAVAVGLVGGSLVRHGPLPAGAAPPVPGPVDTALADENALLRSRLAEAEGDTASRTAFTQQLAHMMLAPRLTAAHVLIVYLPSGQSYVDDTVRMLTAAGADVTGRIGLASSFTEQAHDGELVDLAHSAVPPSVTTGVPVTADGVTASAALLAAVLLRRTPPVTVSDSLSVLLAYSKLGYIDLGGGVAGQADAVVFIAGPVEPDRAAATLAVLGQFDAAGLAVAASPQSTQDMLAARVRLDQTLAPTISTVDNIGSPQGQFVTAWAVADQLLGRAGHYGTGVGAVPMPTTSP